MKICFLLVFLPFSHVVTSRNIWSLFPSRANQPQSLFYKCIVFIFRLCCATLFLPISASSRLSMASNSKYSSTICLLRSSLLDSMVESNTTKTFHLACSHFFKQILAFCSKLSLFIKTAHSVTKCCSVKWGHEAQTLPCIQWAVLCAGNVCNKLEFWKNV